MESVNPKFEPQGVALAPSDRESMPLAQHSTKSLKGAPQGTTLNQEDWEMIEDDLLPFECTAILISLGGVALIALTIHAYQTNAYLVQVGATFLDGMGGGPLLLFFLAIPCVVGTVQILLAAFFSMLAALESWRHVSIQDVLIHHLPDNLERHVRKLPLKCTARKAYLVLMLIFLSIQIVASGIALGLNSYIDTETNKGADAVIGSSGIVREVLDYSATVFNVCCAARGWSRQGFILPCPAGQTDIDSCALPATFMSLQNKLCTCYVTPATTVASYETYINRTNFCAIATQATIPINTGQKIPGTTISIRSIVPPSVKAIPVIGDMDLQFGCGTGFVRGYQWAMVEWSTNELAPYFVAMLSISGVQIVFLIIGSLLVCRIKRQPVTIGEDGNYEYGVAKPIAVPQGLRGLFQKEKMPDGSILSPRLLLPRFRSRTNSSTGGGKSPMSPLGLTTTPAKPSQIANAGLTSPEMMVKAAGRSSKEDQHVINTELTSPELMKKAASHSSKEGQLADNRGLTSPEMMKIAASKHQQLPFKSEIRLDSSPDSKDSAKQMQGTQAITNIDSVI
jgi:hypothetical protein